MKYIKKILSIIVAVAIFGTSGSTYTLIASASDIQEEVQVVEETTGDGIQDSSEEENIESDLEIDEHEEKNAVDQSMQSNEEEIVTSNGLINYVYVESPYLESPAQQKIVVSFGDGKEGISEVTLSVKKTDGSICDIPLKNQENNLYLFEKVYSEAENGVYYIIAFSYIQNGVNESIDLSEIGIGAVFGVDEFYPGYGEESDEEIPKEELDKSVAEVDINDLGEVEDQIENTLADVGVETNISSVSMSRARTTTSNVVVVLDPGHGYGDPGAAGNGVDENTINYKIATYCKQELEEYSGVTVYLTRDMNSNPSIYERVQIAKNYGADVLVSLHNNSSTNPSAHGAEVWYPHANYRPDIGAEGKELAQNIQSELKALGLTDRGIQVKYTQDSTYPDGSKQDWYGIIRYSKEAGFPGIIVEHAFVSNASDVANYLSSDEKLKKLGIADATGIANYFKLKKGKGIAVTSKNDFNGTAQITVSGSGGSANVKIWNQDNPTLVKWYTLSTGRGTVEFKLSDFENKGGVYCAEVYNDDKSEKYCDTSFEMSSDTSVDLKSTSVEDKETVYTLRADFADMPDIVESVTFPVWTTSNQSDLKWLSAKQSSTGVWEATLNVADYNKSGLYNVHAYAVLKDGAKQFLGKLDFTVTEPSMSVSVENYDKDKGTFEVFVRNINAPAGIDKIQVPVWCDAKQKDLIWYTAERQDDGSYKASIDIADHGYLVGEYNIHVYLRTKNGLLKTYVAPNLKVSLPGMDITAQDKDGTESFYTLKVTNTNVVGTVSRIRFAVWSEKKGQDDLVWYEGSKGANGVWTATADIAKNHKTAGIYQLHVYAVLSNGVSKFLDKITFEVSEPEMTVEVKNYQKDKGTFDVVISDIKAVAGISKIQVPVWAEAKQKDLKWYTAQKQNDGSYKVTVNIADHDYLVGDYNIHIYLTAKNSILKTYVAPNLNVTLPHVDISSQDKNGTESAYTLKVTNISMFGNVPRVRFAVWSEKNGQDDLVWYEGIKGTNEEWTSTADIAKNHKTAGTYQLHVYATLPSGASRFVGKTTFEVSEPKMTVNVQNYQKDKGTFDVVISDIESVADVNKIQVPVWCDAKQKDLKWYNAQKQSDGTYKVTVDIADHGYLIGYYNIHIYFTAKNGVLKTYVAPNLKVSLPNVGITSEDKDGTEKYYTLKVTKPNIFGTVSRVQFAVWSEKNGQDDLVWYEGNKGANDVWTSTADIGKNHKTAGTYQLHVYVTLQNGTRKFLGETTFEVTEPKMSVNVTNYQEDQGTFDVIIKDINSASGVRDVRVPVWCSSNQKDIYWYTATKQSDESYKVTVSTINHNHAIGEYKVHVYLTADNGVCKVVVAPNQTVVSSGYYPIMGENTVTVDQMVKYYQSSGATYPASELSKGGASTLEQFCQMYYEEAAAEGVHVEVAFAQAMKETGWLRYGGIVQIGQFNFAGLGALDGNAAGNCASFPDVRTGIRAQIQHLKAYGSTEALKNTCVDPRFSLVKRGVAPYVEWLGIKENPSGVGWATAEKYGYSIVEMIKKLKSIK